MNKLKPVASEMCYICGKDISPAIRLNIYGKNVCKNNLCVIRIKNEVIKRLGFTEFVNFLEFERENSDSSLNLIKRFGDLKEEKLKIRNIKRFKGKKYVFRVEIPKREVSMLIGLNYAYKINKQGKVFKVYNLNEQEESLEEIKRRLSSEDMYVLEPFLLLLDERKSVQKWNSI